jgi:two-component system CheB/CheR fusion protein
LSAGCASGQQAYAFAMILADALGEELFQSRVKNYATDVDLDALNVARQGVHSERNVADVPSDLLQKYFEREIGNFVVRKDLRRSLVLGRHNLVPDAPISRVDILVCRTTPMYFNAETQARVLSKFRFALNNSGLLFPGKAEMLLSFAWLFSPIALRWRICRGIFGDGRGVRLTFFPSASAEEISSTTGSPSMKWPYQLRISLPHQHRCRIRRMQRLRIRPLIPSPGLDRT